MKLKMLSDLLLLIAVPIFIMAAVLLFGASKEARFEVVKGTVQTSKIEKYRYTRGGETYGSVSWRLFVNYDYEFGGEDYEGDRVSTSLPISTTLFGKPPSKKLTRLAEQFKPGKSVNVYVNSASTRKAVLMPTSYSKGLKWVLAGLALLAISFYLKRN
ncbi:DUF3592 domain-containing protein [Hellea sp.]|nr:DUF3592 domain-containing protein [Hellea sp.]